MAHDTNWNTEAQSDAKDLVRNFEDEVAQQLVDKGKASDDWNNYDGGDSYFHESYVDKSYALIESAELLEQLDEHEETDSGLWEGLSPREAIGAQAAYTYGNAVWDEAKDLIEQINDRWNDRETPENEDDDAKEQAAKAIIAEVIGS